MADQCLGTIATRTVAGLSEDIDSVVIPVHPYRVFLTKTALASGSDPTGLARHDDEQIALIRLKQPCHRRRDGRGMLLAQQKRRRGC
jgi:hypothetical protein